MMKALVKSKAAPGLWLEDVPKPEPGINDVLIRVLRTAICGTDVHIYKWDAWAQKTIPVPMVVGHEFVGRVVAVGRGRVGSGVGVAEGAFIVTTTPAIGRSLEPSRTCPRTSAVRGCVASDWGPPAADSTSAHPVPSIAASPAIRIMRIE